jgi:ABC-type multidrug transport system ATPase subunit
MSEQILKALMQLFAIIARPDSSTSDRRTVVRAYLKKQLNHEIVQEYLKVFDEFYTLHQEKQKESDKRERRISSSSVRVLKIATSINEELAQPQKIIVLIRLLEFVRSDNEEITEQEMEFINTVSVTFNVLEEEYEQIRDFVLSSPEDVPDTEDIMMIDNNRDFKSEKSKHICIDSIRGQLRVLHVPSARLYFVRYIGAHEMYMNSQLIQEDKIYVLNNGSSIKNQQIKSIFYSDIVSRFQLDKIKDRITFDVSDIEYHFRTGETGLHKLSFKEESGRLIGIMGASGAGKSTLLNVLNGSVPPSAGKVLVNGVDIFSEKEKIEGIIGHVSQDDLLIEELTVYQNLYYNAKLCFDNYSEDQIVETVNQTLENIGLFEIRDIMVGSPLNKKISGGQRKRLNITLELIREPAILFLDEPTSGLSSRDSENIMDLLKELSLKGKLVFVVIHQPSSDIFKMFDNMIILDTGGWMIYDGDPIESIVYFKKKIHHANCNESECQICGNVNPEQIFNIVESNVLDEYGKATKTRKISPREWHTHYLEKEKENGKFLEQHFTIPEILFKIPNKLKQFRIFVNRDVLSKLSNTQYMVINFMEAPLLAFLLAYIIKYFNVNVTNVHGYNLEGNSNLPVYIFMSVIVAIFMGLTGSAEELIKDRKIKKREAFLNLSRSGYLLSKVAVLMALSAIQALLFVVIGNSIMEIKGMYWQYWLVLFSAWVSSNLLGLIISDSFKTVVTIYILIPFLVIPQIILSGVIVKYEKLNPKISSPTSIPFYGEIMTARWAYEALATYQFMNNDYQSKFYLYDKVMSEAGYLKDYWTVDLTNKVESIERNLHDPAKAEEIEQHLQLLRDEIGNELKNNTHITFAHLADLTPERINADILGSTNSYLNEIRGYNIKLYNKASTEKDKLTRELQKTEEQYETFHKIKREQNNTSLEEFVKNSNVTDRIIQYKNRLYQKIHPIYMDPQHKLLRAHFYAPRKQVFGNFFSTFAVNIAIIWLMTILFYIVLYYRLLKKFLDFFEQFSHRIRRNG